MLYTTAFEQSGSIRPLLGQKRIVFCTVYAIHANNLLSQKPPWGTKKYFVSSCTFPSDRVLQNDGLRDLAGNTDANGQFGVQSVEIYRLDFDVLKIQAPSRTYNIPFTKVGPDTNGPCLRYKKVDYDKGSDPLFLQESPQGSVRCRLMENKNYTPRRPIECASKNCYTAQRAKPASPPLIVLFLHLKLVYNF